MDAWRPMLAWGQRHPRAADVAFGVLLTVLALAGLLLAEPTATERDPDLLAVALTVGAHLPLVLRRQRPLTVLLIVAAATFPFWILDYSTSIDPGLPFALFAATSHGIDRTRTWQIVSAVVAAATFLGFVGAVFAPDEDLPRIAVLGIFVVFATAAILGEVVFQRRRHLAELEQRAIDLEADLETKARLAALDERTRIAREMHDIVSHGMSAVVVQAGAAQRMVDIDPDRAREALGHIESIGRESLEEMRRMLGVLRDPSFGVELAPQPSIDDFKSLATTAIEAGIDTAMEVQGEPRPVAPGVQLTAYRVVQEALTNVIRHAGRPASAEVTITYDPHALVLDIVDNGLGVAASPESAGGGHGLTGMQERVALYNGTLDARPRPGGGFRVHAVLPTEPTAIGSDPPLPGPVVETGS